jgi:NADPH:quinone reductase-like Zn-dependent oxidoreductase
MHAHPAAAAPSNPVDDATSTMRAVVLEEEGGPEVLVVRDVPVPEPDAGQVRIRLSKAALNHLDVWIRKGMPSVDKPRIMGADGCGVVDAIGAGVDPGLVGQRVLIDPSITCGQCRYCLSGESAMCDRLNVLGEHSAGTHAQYVVVPAINVHVVPGHLDDAAAAALPLTFCTAWRMIRTRAQAQPGERMLVWGASAGVGCAAIQLAQAMGIETIATSRSDDKLTVLRELGATHVINSEREDVVEACGRITGGDGVDVVFDHLGDVAWKPSMFALARGGRFVTCGATTGAAPKALITRIFWKQLTILGSTMASKRDFEEMLRFVSFHQIVPRVDRTFPLEQISAAHEWLESAGQVGKVVLDTTAG